MRIVKNDLSKRIKVNVLYIYFFYSIKQNKLNKIYNAL